VTDKETLQLAPVYDMLPMMFAPRGNNLFEHRFDPQPANANNYDIWSTAAEHAAGYWARLTQCQELSRGFRKFCTSSLNAFNMLRKNFSP